MSSPEANIPATAQFETERAKQRDHLLSVARGEGVARGHTVLFEVFTIVLIGAAFFLTSGNQLFVSFLLLLAVQLAHSASTAYAKQRIDALLKLVESGRGP